MMPLALALYVHCLVLAQLMQVHLLAGSQRYKWMHCLLYHLRRVRGRLRLCHKHHIYTANH
jgi:hypothetical protein